MYLLHVLILDSLLQKLEALRGNQYELGCETTVLAYADGTTIIVSNTRHLYLIDDALKD